MSTKIMIINKSHSPSIVDLLRFMVVFLFVSACSQTIPKSTKMNLEKLAQNSYGEKNYVASRAYYEQAIQQAPSVESYIGLARSLEGLNEWYKASEIWFAISKIDTLEPTVQATYIINASKDLIRSNDIIGAKKTIHSLNAGQIQIKGAQTVLGLIYVIEGKKEPAISIFTEIREEFPDDLAIQSNLGLTYLVFDEPSKAIEILEKISDGESSKLNHAIAKAYFGKEDAALTLLQEIQTDEDARRTIEFARYLKKQNVKTRAKLLFGITAEN